ncbi:hypothetical protein LTS08_005633 [Lithohypha guttulata]|uniref:uncharacterized protein n=1 Tax=Lithohypha guttulata TaxID=1690604 RepID=UPI002DDDF329|nr:hypothetical protein LTR51_003197 [Lithohypha guttulata]KAK5099918.1 hypothetical protein LTS08_005633 [Lithohypha guttulata]
MDYYPDIGAMMTGNRDEDANLVNHVLGQIWGIMDGDKALAKRTWYRVNKVRSAEEAQLNSLSKLTEVDPSTKSLLEQEESIWSHDPSAFWGRTQLGQARRLDPQGQIVQFYMQRSTDDA